MKHTVLKLTAIFLCILLATAICNEKSAFSQAEDNVVFRTQNGIVVVFGPPEKLYAVEDAYKKESKNIIDVYDWLKKTYPDLKAEKYNMLMSYKFGKWGLDLKLREAEVMGLIPDIEGLSIGDATVILQKDGYEILNSLEQQPKNKRAVFLEGTSNTSNIHIFFEGFIYQQP